MTLDAIKAEKDGLELAGEPVEVPVAMPEPGAAEQLDEAVLTLVSGLAHPAYAAYHHAVKAEGEVAEIDALGKDAPESEGAKWWSEHRKAALAAIDALKAWAYTWDKAHPEFHARPELPEQEAR